MDVVEKKKKKESEAQRVTPSILHSSDILALSGGGIVVDLLHPQRECSDKHPSTHLRILRLQGSNAVVGVAV
jgi:hypothetical protein